MLPEIGATELMVIAAVALIVVGPKDLPLLLRKLGQFVARLRGMANEFRSSFDEMARQSELEELRREVAAMRAGQSTFDPVDGAEVTKVFDEIDADLKSTPSPESYFQADSIPVPLEPEPATIEAAPAAKPARKPAAKTPATTKAASPKTASSKPAAPKPAAPKPAAPKPAAPKPAAPKSAAKTRKAKA